MRAERRGRAVRGCVRPINQKLSGRSRVDELKSPGKPFEISKRAVWEAWEKVRANKGAPGVDGESVADFEKDLKGNLYKIWNRMSSGTYFPPPVRAVEIAKAHGPGTRILGVPTVADRIAQTVVAGVLEERAEPALPPGLLRVPPEALRAGRGGCLPAAVLGDGLGDRSGHPEVLRQRAVGPGGQGCRRRTPTCRGWCCMCGGGSRRRCGCPTGPCGSVTGGPRRGPRFRPCSPTCSCTTRSMPGWPGSSRASGSSGTWTTRWCTASAEAQARMVLAALEERMAQVGLTLHPDKTRIVYCRDGRRRARMSTRRSRSSGIPSGPGECGRRPGE